MAAKKKSAPAEVQTSTRKSARAKKPPPKKSAAATKSPKKSAAATKSPKKSASAKKSPKKSAAKKPLVRGANYDVSLFSATKMPMGGICLSSRLTWAPMKVLSVRTNLAVVDKLVRKPSRLRCKTAGLVFPELQRGLQLTMYLSKQVMQVQLLGVAVIYSREGHGGAIRAALCCTRRAASLGKLEDQQWNAVTFVNANHFPDESKCTVAHSHCTHSRTTCPDRRTLPFFVTTTHNTPNFLTPGTTNTPPHQQTEKVKLAKTYKVRECNELSSPRPGSNFIAAPPHSEGPEGPLRSGPNAGDGTRLQRRSGRPRRGHLGG